jgi:hypothetical protein
VAEQTEQGVRRPGERVTLWFLLAFSVFILITALKTLKFENLSSSGVFPVFIAALMIASALFVLWKNRFRYTALRLVEECRGLGPFVFPRTVGIYTGILVLYILLLERLHFWPSAFLFLVGSFLFLKGAGWVRSVIVAIGMLVAIYVLFQYIFTVILW